MTLQRMVGFSIVLILVLVPGSARSQIILLRTSPESDRLVLSDAKGHTLKDNSGNNADKTISDMDEGDPIDFSVDVNRPNSGSVKGGVVILTEPTGKPGEDDAAGSPSDSIDLFLFSGGTPDKLHYGIIMASDPSPFLLTGGTKVEENGALQDLTRYFFPDYFFAGTNTLKKKDNPPPLFVEAQSDVPEPSSVSLLGIALLPVGVVFWKSRRSRAS